MRLASAILVVSSERYSGKSSLIVGLALELIDRGFSVGYMKPVGSYPVKIDSEKVEEDAYFVSEALGLQAPLSDVTPFYLTWETVSRYMRKKPGDPRGRVVKSYSRLSKGKDIMLVEGAHNFIQGKILGLSSKEVAELLDTRVLLLDTFNEDLTIDSVLAARDYFGEKYVGAVLNWVPERRMHFVRGAMVRFMESNGVKVFGSVPADRVLRSISVEDLAVGLNGTVICARDKCDELVESMMVGAMGQEQALRLFRKQANKVVVTGGDRADIQLAALQTSTKCLVLTGGHRPSPMVLGQAEETGVPIIMVDDDTATAVEMVDSAIGRQKLHSPKKVERMRGFIKEGFKLNSLLHAVGMTSRKKK